MGPIIEALNRIPGLITDCSGHGKRAAYVVYEGAKDVLDIIPGLPLREWLPPVSQERSYQLPRKPLVTKTFHILVGRGVANDEFWERTDRWAQAVMETFPPTPTSIALLKSLEIESFQKFSES